MTTATATSLFPSLAHDANFAPQSRVWVYTAHRPLTNEETSATQQALDSFARQWTAHNQALLAKAEVFQNQFVLLMVDESRAGASGCSIDKSVHFLEGLGQELGVDFFERMRFAWVENHDLKFANRDELAAQVGSGHIAQDTLMVNTLAQSKRELEEKWLVPYGQSWHQRLV